MVDVPKLQNRRRVIADEMHYIRMHPDAMVIESYVPISAMRGDIRESRSISRVKPTISPSLFKPGDV